MTASRTARMSSRCSPHPRCRAGSTCPLATADPPAAWPQGLAVAAVTALALFAQQAASGAPLGTPPTKAKNVIFFVGDGMGVSTVTATRVFSVGVAGQLQLDKFPFTALSRTYSEDSITADSAPTMTAMITGQNTNAGVIGLDKTTENKDFNGDGDGAALTTLIELAQAAGKKTGVVSTARITHATPAACYAHINNRDNENAIALQALPTDPTYNAALGSGVDLLVGGGRQFFRAEHRVRRGRQQGQPHGRARPARRIPGGRLLLRLGGRGLQCAHLGRSAGAGAA